jgi:uncharacterized membrane protein
MAKHQRQDRLAKNTRGDIMIEQQNLIDDSLLPSALELEKLKSIDPSIIQWILQRTEMEQDGRLNFNKKQIEIAELSVRKTHSFNITALVFSFILFLMILGLSAFFVFKELPVTGTVFGGAAIFVAVTFFIKATIKPQNTKG